MRCIVSKPATDANSFCHSAVSADTCDTKRHLLIWRCLFLFAIHTLQHAHFFRLGDVALVYTCSGKKRRHDCTNPNISVDVLERTVCKAVRQVLGTANNVERLIQILRDQSGEIQARAVENLKRLVAKPTPSLASESAFSVRC